MNWSDIEAELENVDRKDALERAKGSPALRAALELSRPQNWWGTGIPPERLLKIAQEDGIPVAWVPPAELLIEVAAVATREERLTILRANQDKVFSHCEMLLSECIDEWIADERYLVDKILSAFQAGHQEAALALAVSIGEPLSVWASTPRVVSFRSDEEEENWRSNRQKLRKYKWAGHELGEILATGAAGDFLRAALIAPIPAFFAPFWPSENNEVPTRLSRHAVVHTAKKKLFSLDNALLALMLVSSILRDMQRWSEEVRMTDEGPE